MSAVREFSSVTLTNNSNLVQINTNDSNFSVVPGSVIFIAGDRPRVVTSGNTVNRTLTLAIAYMGNDIVEKSATLIPLGQNDALLSAITSLTQAQNGLAEAYGDGPGNVSEIIGSAAHIVEMSGPGDGTTIDTQSILDDLADLYTKGGGILKGKPNKTYVLDSLFEINQSNLIIDLSGSTIKWVGDTSGHNNDRTRGIFRFRGQTIENESKQCQIVIPAPALHSREIIVDGTLSITLSKGDYLNFQAQASGGYLVNANYSLLTIVDSVSYDSGSDKTTITVNDNLPFEYNNTAKLSRCEVLKNVGVINAHLVDEKSTTRDNGICGVNFGLVDGLIMDRVTMEGPYFPVATIYNYRNAVVQNGYAWDAKATEGGQGYYVQFGGGSHTYCFNVHIVNGRHTVDFNQCYHALVENCTGTGADSADFQSHGSWEYDLTFRRCVGTFNIAGSGAQFGSMAKKFTIDDCTGKSLLSYAFAHDIHVNNSTFELVQMRANDAHMNNVKVTNYARFFNASHPAYEVENRLIVKGGVIKSETYNGANFIYEGANVEFHGTEVYCQWNSNAVIQAPDLTMYGGVFYGGFLSDTHRGRWEFNGTTFDNTTFVLNNYTFDKAELVMINPKVRDMPPTGLIRNFLDPTNYTLRANADLDSTSTGKYNLQILGGVIEADVDGDKAIDLAQPRASLNIDIRGLCIKNGKFVCDMRYPLDNVGYIHIDLARIDNEDDVSISPFEARYESGAEDIHTIFDFLPKVTRGNQNKVEYFFPINAFGDEDWQANHYPIDEKPVGMLKARFDRRLNTKTLIMNYEDGRAYQQINAGNGWSPWTRLTPFTDTELMAQLDAKLTDKINTLIQQSNQTGDRYYTAISSSRASYFRFENAVSVSSGDSISIDFVTIGSQEKFSTLFDGNQTNRITARLNDGNWEFIGLSNVQIDGVSVSSGATFTGDDQLHTLTATVSAIGVIDFLGTNFEQNPLAFLNGILANVQITRNSALVVDAPINETGFASTNEAVNLANSNNNLIAYNFASEDTSRATY